ncbi:MAG TPA: hypothetical protein VJ813_14230 [Vicinamibacterales bacterium]|nr:hypothetical protein [Vicinamibacterales bacterium]
MPLDLRPLTLGELFDRAFMLYRRHFWLFVGITAIPGIFALLMTLAQQGLQGATVPPPNAAAADPAAVAETFVTMAWWFAGMMIAMVGYWIAYMIGLGATTFAVSEIYVGRSVTISYVYGRMRGRIGALIILLLLIALRVVGLLVLGMFTIGMGIAIGTIVSPILGGLFAVLLGVGLFGAFVFMTLRYGVAVPVLVLEGLPPGESIRRSIELTKGRLGRVFLLVLCATMITYAALVLFQGPFFFAALLAGFDTTRGLWLNVAGAVSGTIGATLTTPFMIIGLALIYYDARIREEGLDLELTLAALDGAPDAARA